MSVYDMAMKYYPHLWSESRIDTLVEAGRLTQEEANEIKSMENFAEDKE